MSSSRGPGQTDSEFHRDYIRRLRESEGYDVGDHDPPIIGNFPIRPFCLDFPEDLELMAKYSNLALKKYNRNNGTDYKFVKVLRATYGTGGARAYFITFQVEDSACPESPTSVSSFRARVFDGWKRESIVEYCAPEP